MTKDQKIIRAKGLLELAKQFGNVSQACKISQACKMMATAGTASTGSGISTTKAGSWRFRRRRAASRS